MALLEWKDQYLLGIAPLDFEHKDLIERINDLYARCSASADPSAAADCLGRLHARLSAHFALEEKTMRDMNNPHYVAHKAEHDRFLDEVTEVAERFGTDAPVEEDMEAFARRMHDWLVNHITTFDRTLVEHGH